MTDAATAQEAQALPRPEHLCLGELITRLEQEPPGKRIAVGFNKPCSYRGYYEQLAFEITGPITIADMLAAARAAKGSVYSGWKGGEHEMREYTACWLVAHPGDCGESIGAVLLELLLANEVRP